MNTNDRGRNHAESPPVGRRGSHPTDLRNSTQADPLDLLDEVPLTDDEAGYVDAARAANTLRGYRSDWREFTTWCSNHHLDPIPATPATITGYLTDLAHAGAKTGTMSRRLSALKFAHQLRNLPDPTTNARVLAVWEGIRRTHGAPPVTFLITPQGVAGHRRRHD